VNSSQSATYPSPGVVRQQPGHPWKRRSCSQTEPRDSVADQRRVLARVDLELFGPNRLARAAVNPAAAQRWIILAAAWHPLHQAHGPPTHLLYVRETTTAIRLRCNDKQISGINAGDTRLGSMIASLASAKGCSTFEWLRARAATGDSLIPRRTVEAVYFVFRRARRKGFTLEPSGQQA